MRLWPMLTQMLTSCGNDRSPDPASAQRWACANRRLSPACYPRNAMRGVLLQWQVAAGAVAPPRRQLSRGQLISAKRTTECVATLAYSQRRTRAQKSA